MSIHLERCHLIRGSRVVCAAVVLSLLVSLLAGCNFLPDEEQELAPPLVEPQEISYRTITIEPASIVNNFRGTGSVVASRTETVMFTEDPGHLDRFEISVGDHVEEGDALVLLNTENVERQLETAQLEHRKVEIAYLQTQERYNAGQAGAYDLERSAIDLEISEIRLNRLIQQRDRAQLNSPLAGRVIFVADLEHNDYVDVYQPLVTVADMSSLKIRYTGDEYRSLIPGTEVLVNISRVMYEAVVIASGADAPDDVADSIRDSALIETLEPLPEGIRPGTSAFFEYELERSDNTIVIPRRLLNTASGRKFVNVLEDGLRVEKDVETGIQNNTEIEIISGLSFGDAVIDR